MLWTVFDDLVQSMSSNAEQLASARRVFSAVTGTVEPDHELYAERSDAFVEWFLFEQLDEDGFTRIDRQLFALPSSAPQRPYLWALRSSHRSLFQVVRLLTGGLLLDDLIGGGRFSVDERRRLPGVQAGDQFEARLIADPDRRPALCFGRALQFHPREAADSVHAQLQRAKINAEPRAELLSRLARLRVRCFSYRHLSAARIYAPTA